MKVRLMVNARHREVVGVGPTESLMTLLRERLELRGTKNACEQGECGSCTVYLDGSLVCACLVAAGQADGGEVVTIEGLRADRISEAFLAAGAVQCGFCTPGFIVAADNCLRHESATTDARVREALSGNLCRCTGYGQILQAVRQAGEMEQPDVS
jgi:aerobic carbon-monoxide dehydrogenase small subunit